MIQPNKYIWKNSNASSITASSSLFWNEWILVANKKIL